MDTMTSDDMAITRRKPIVNETVKLDNGTRFQKEDIKKMRKLFDTIDKSGDGCLSRQEIIQYVSLRRKNQQMDQLENILLHTMHD